MKTDQRFRKKINFRQLGGYPTKDGRVIKENIFYRSGGPFRMNRSEVETLRQLPLCTVIDLRSAKEIAECPDPVLPHAKMIKHSGAVSEGGEDIDFSSEGMSRIGEGGKDQLARLKQYYARMPFNNHAFQIMFREIQAGNVPILIHCASGKDRTGVACMLILLALGVERQTIIEDYLLTNLYRQEQIEKLLVRDADVIRLHPEREELDRMLAGVTKEIGEIVLDSIEKEYPDINDYFQKEFQLTKEDLQLLKERYTDL